MKTHHEMLSHYIEMTLSANRKRLTHEMQGLRSEIDQALRDLADERFGGTTTRLSYIQQIVGGLIERNAKVVALSEVNKLLADEPTPHHPRPKTESR